MGFLGGLLGGGTGAGYQASGVTADQLQQALNQSQAGIGQQQGFVNSLQGLGGQGIGAQQAALTGLQGVANGTGPNPAQTMLNQSTGQNVANQAALMASQRGVGSNTGLLARQAAQQGAGIQQNAAGQAATLQAQQQLGALGQLGQQGQAATGEQGQALGQLQGSQQSLANLYGQNLQSQNAANAGVAKQNAATQGQLFSGAANGIATGLAGLAHGGMAGVDFSQFEGYADGGVAAPTLPQQGPASYIGKALSGMGSDDPIAQQTSDTVSKLFGAANKLFQPSGIGAGIGGAGASDLPGLGSGMMVASRGGHVPGRPKVMGDNEANDTVPAMLSPGEIVVPRTKAHDPKAAAKFAAAVALRNKKH